MNVFAGGKLFNIESFTARATRFFRRNLGFALGQPFYPPLSVRRRDRVRHTALAMLLSSPFPIYLISLFLPPPLQIFAGVPGHNFPDIRQMRGLAAFRRLM